MISAGSAHSPELSTKRAFPQQWNNSCNDLVIFKKKEKTFPKDNKCRAESGKNNKKHLHAAKSKE
jgi:hypothetical protein